MARELELLKCVIPNEFVVGCIIGFGITLKHKRQKISVENLIASLDVEKKDGAKNTIEKGNNLVQRNPHGKNKGKNKPFNARLTSTFEKKKNKAELSCFTYGELGHFFQ
jgi:hypothetical protein